MMDKKNFRIVYMGTPEFAVAPLKTLVDNGYRVVAVVTMPDKPAGRGMHLRKSAVKEYAEQAGLPVLQPERLKDPGFVETLRGYKADIQIVVAFRMLPEVVWNMPLHGTFNLHASLLPAYRGAAPINRAIMNGDTETGVTTFFLQHAIDTGNIIMQRKTPIGEDDNAGTLHDRLMEIGADVVKETLDRIIAGTAETTAQDDRLAQGKEAPKIFKEDCRVEWSGDCRGIRNFVRGLSPYPAAWADVKIGGVTFEKMKILAVERADAEASAVAVGEAFVQNGRLYVGTGDGVVRLTEIQPAGKKAMGDEAFVRGLHV